MNGTIQCVNERKNDRSINRYDELIDRKEGKQSTTRWPSSQCVKYFTLTSSEPVFHVLKWGEIESIRQSVTLIWWTRTENETLGVRHGAIEPAHEYRMLFSTSCLHPFCNGIYVYVEYFNSISVSAVSDRTVSRRRLWSNNCRQHVQNTKPSAWRVDRVARSKRK